MSHSIDPVADEFIPRTYPYTRPIALVLLLVAEIALFSFRFDAPTRFGEGLWWAALIAQSRLVIRVSLAIPIAVMALGGLRLRVRVRRAFELQDLGQADWTWWVLAHGLALAVFARLTVFLCEGELAASSHPGTWTLGWIAAGLTVATTWLGILLPLATWRSILWRSRRAVLMGTSASIAAFLLGNSTSLLWESMAGVTLSMVRAMLGLLSNQVQCDPGSKTLMFQGFVVRVAAPCSGFEGIGLVVSFLSAYLWWFRSSLRWPMAYLLLPIGAVVIYLTNAVRIAALVLIGAWVSPEVALGGFHSQAGWFAFLVVSLGLVAASRRSSFFVLDRSALATESEWNPSAAFLMPFLAVLATSMATGAFSSGFDRFYGLRVLTGGVALWCFRREFVGLLRGWSWMGVGVGVLAFGLWVALEPASTGGGRSLALAVGDLPKGETWTWIALRVIGSVAIIPLAEELAFRGYLTRRLISVDFLSVPIGQLTWLPLLASSAAFGLLHGRWLAGTIVGVLYGLVLSRRGKLGDAVVAHAVTNALIAASVLATGDWTMWT